ncbi:hypothetical protein ABIF75_004582 [Bradyrhizobium japonicum]
MSRENFWFFHPFRVRYSEIDGQGVVFNAHYLTYFDTTITEYFRALGFDQYADAQASGIDFHVVKSLIEYKAPVRFDSGARRRRARRADRQFEPRLRARHLPEGWHRCAGDRRDRVGLHPSGNPSSGHDPGIDAGDDRDAGASSVGVRPPQTGKNPFSAGMKKIPRLIAKPMLQRIERSVGRLPR